MANARSEDYKTAEIATKQKHINNLEVYLVHGLWMQ
jgi:hypothetical protein